MPVFTRPPLARLCSSDQRAKPVTTRLLPLSMDTAWISIVIAEREAQLELAGEAEKIKQYADPTAATGDASKGANLFKVSLI